jgi:hypothetical protein
MENSQTTQQQCRTHFRYLGYLNTLGHLALATHYGKECPGLGVTIEYLTGETRPWGKTVEYEVKFLHLFIDYQSDGKKSVRWETETEWMPDTGDLIHDDLYIVLEVSRTSTS